MASLASFQQIETFAFKIELRSGSEKRDGLADASFKFEGENQSKLVFETEVSKQECGKRECASQTKTYYKVRREHA